MRRPRRRDARRAGKRRTPARHIQQHGVSLAKLEPLLSVLQSDPQQHEQLQQDYAQAQACSVRLNSRRSR
ncbi:hypothetical protein M8494_16200 [Serratia ureilytica]